ncbi:MAG: hypothetical protein JSS66_03485 [Armatimonadetes bacterium]|nr:hypothetical protein [Armatimonadota bacterium]
MFGLVGYSIGAFVVASILTVVVAMFRPIKQNDDWKAWKWILGFMALTMVVPYAYAEVMTMSFGKPLKQGVQEAIDEAGCRGSLVFYKVMRANDKKAHLIAVVNDKNEFGWPERAVFEVDVVKEKDGWHADAYTIVNSFHRNRDATTMPPYW